MVTPVRTALAAWLRARADRHRETAVDFDRRACLASVALGVDGALWSLEAEAHRLDAARLDRWANRISRVEEP